jgi:hypothetical protein
MLGSSSVAAQLAAPQEGLSSVSKHIIEKHSFLSQGSKILVFGNAGEASSHLGLGN